MIFGIAYDMIIYFWSNMYAYLVKELNMRRLYNFFYLFFIFELSVSLVFLNFLSLFLCCKINACYLINLTSIYIRVYQLTYYFHKWFKYNIYIYIIKALVLCFLCVFVVAVNVLILFHGWIPHILCFCLLYINKTRLWVYSNDKTI